MASYTAVDGGLSSRIVSARQLVFPGGINVGSVRVQSGVISQPTLATKTTGDVLTAANVVGGLIVADANAANLTLEIPVVQAILAAFANNGVVFSSGDQFEAIFVRGPNGAGDLVLAAAAPGPGETAVTWAIGAAPVHLTAAGGATTHVAKLIFEITSVATPAIRIHVIVG